MFKITSEPKFTHPVRVMVPVDGGHEEQSFKATFRVLDADRLEAIQDESGQKGVLQQVIVGFDELVDDNGQAVPYSDGLRDQLIGNPNVRISLFRTYLSAISKAPEGN